MKLQGKITEINLDYLTHKPKVTIQLSSQKELFTDEFADLKNNEIIDIEISKHRNKRSLNANSYAWTLIGKIAEVVGNTKEEVYKDYIRNKGVFRIITINEKALNTFTKVWQERGLGWICETSKTDIPEFIDVIAYYGTSSYNTKQMANFIDYLVQEAKNLNIETLPPHELESLKENWENVKSK